MEKLKVSVVMATFNEPKQLIEKSINSILNQTHRNLELLIADDSTSDETRAVIDGFASIDKRVVVIRKSERMGFVPALNNALNEVTGNFVARMDGDDISLPDRFERQIAYMNANPLVDICGGNLNIMDENDTIRSKREYPVGERQISRYFIYRTSIAHPTAMFRRKIVDAGFRYDPSFKKAEDLNFWLTLRNAGFKFGNLGVPLLNYRVIGDLGAKRSRAQYQYIMKARRQNFSFKFFVFDVASLIICSMYLITPMKLISWFYNRENRGKK